ncbi:MAG: NUMOD3 domain-containing DNA-binding protein [Christensenellaceae bacterium]
MSYYCERCGKFVTKHYGSARFCSSECAGKRPQTEETKQKISKANKGQAPTSGSFRVGHKPVGNRKIAAEKVSLAWKIKKENRTYDELNIKERVLFDQANRCNCCGINEWQGRPITLELHHRRQP